MTRNERKALAQQDAIIRHLDSISLFEDAPTGGGTH